MYLIYNCVCKKKKKKKKKYLSYPLVLNSKTVSGKGCNPYDSKVLASTIFYQLLTKTLQRWKFGLAVDIVYMLRI